MYLLLTNEIDIASRHSYAATIQKNIHENTPTLAYGRMRCIDKKMKIAAAITTSVDDKETDYYLVSLPQRISNRAAFDWAFKRINDGTYKWESYSTHPYVEDVVGSNLATLKRMETARLSYPCIWVPADLMLPASNKNLKHLLTKADD